jgi:BirA family transcriptional regulator, biotin operon repressor / biotin---[acetyl-CoA-carboxylase] ligase
MKINRIHFNSIDSTNTWAKQHAQELAQDALTLITAHTQTAGRGRFKRKWESPPGQNIYATFCFFREKFSAEIGNIPQVLAISTANVLKELHVNLKPELKWPNDVLLSEKKIAGILAETTFVNKLCVVIGIGLNINMPIDLLQQIDRPATSLCVETGQIWDVEFVLKHLEEEFIQNLKLFFQKGFSPFLETYRLYMANIGTKKIRFHDNQRIWEGTFHSITQEGALNLTLPSGEIKTFIAGEILPY